MTKRNDAHPLDPLPQIYQNQAVFVQDIRVTIPRLGWLLPSHW